MISINVIIGKYVELKDAYKSLDEALTHGGINNNVKVKLVRIDSEKLKVSEIKSKLKDISGILIPGGFGKRGTDGKIEAIKYARNNKIPFLGICYGLDVFDVCLEGRITKLLPTLLKLNPLFFGLEITSQE